MLDGESINSSSPLGLDLGFLLLFERKSILFKSRRASGSFQSATDDLLSKTTGQPIEKKTLITCPQHSGHFLIFFCFSTKVGFALRRFASLFSFEMRI